MQQKPFCGFPYGFHEFASLPEMPEDDCCVHCGRPRYEIEGIEPERIKCECNYFDKDHHPNYPNICVACGRPISSGEIEITDKEFEQLKADIKNKRHELEILQQKYMKQTGKV